MDLIIAHMIQYILAAVGLWQLITGTMLYGIMILLLVVASDIVVQKIIEKATNKN